MNDEEKISAQKQIEIENEENINNLIDYISLHINNRMQNEYLKFVKNMRNLRKNINDKKLKLAQNGMLEESYQKKDGVVRKYFREMAYEYKYKKEKSYRFGVDTELIYPIVKQPRRMSTNGYIELGARATFKDIERQERMKEQEYDSTVSYVMKEVLGHYKFELDFWEKCLKEIEELENIREFE
mgnify:CR=1 FL=1